MVSFLEYLGFFGAVFFTEQLEMVSRMDFNMFFGIVIFDPKSGFCMGYSLCMMADFQNGLISGPLFAQNNSKGFVEGILTCFFKF